jgi:RNase H-like domain found in reverse transcriptase/Reverse transcriptase (RNA-dependent DNA polymerase)/Integrase zinc binding domain
MVLKKDGSWWPCGDYRQLNAATVPDKYPVPYIADMAAKLAGSSMFTKLVHRKGYYQIPMTAEDIPKTAVITPFGLFYFTRMPFGLRNAGQSFQRLMDSVMANLDSAFAYLDDVLVASTPEEHEGAVRAVLERLHDNGLVLNLEKFEFGKTEIDFLGHRVTAAGGEPLVSHVEAVREFPPPADKQSLQRFLGLVNFFRRFLPGAAGMLKLLTNALRGPGGKKPPLTWTDSMAAAFAAKKEALCMAVQLAHPDPAAEVSLAVDVSDWCVGAVLHQQEGSSWRPLVFYSKKLDAAHHKYSAFDRELWAAYLAVRHFRFQLERRPFIIFTDNKPLTFALKQQSQPWTARQQRQLSFLAEFTSDLRHVSGESNVVADVMSRPGIIPWLDPEPGGETVAGLNRAERCHNQHVINKLGSTPSLVAEHGVATVQNCSVGMDFAALAAEQSRRADCEVMQASASLQVRRCKIDKSEVLCDMSTEIVRPLVRAAWRLLVFAALHNIAHPGIRASKRLIAARYIWPSMAADIAQMCSAC